MTTAAAGRCYPLAIVRAGVAIGAAAALTAAALGACGGSQPLPQAAPVGGPAVSIPTDDPAAAAARALLAVAPPPATLVIPALGVRASVESVGMDAQGRMATPSQADHVAWYSPGPAPGDPGDAVIDGHLDWTRGPAVFWRLSSLHAGDQVTVLRGDGSQARFTVDASATLPFDAQPAGLFTRDGPPSLSLVTCSGAWDRQRGTYRDRLVVHAVLVPDVPTASPGDEGG